MTAREKRVVKAFQLCVEKGEYTPEYAILLLEDNARYGWLSERAKDAFYEWLDEWESRQEPEPEPEEEEA